MKRETRALNVRISRNENEDLLALLQEEIRQGRTHQPTVSRIVRRLIREAAAALRKRQAPPSSNPSS